MQSKTFNFSPLRPALIDINGPGYFCFEFYSVTARHLLRVSFSISFSITTGNLSHPATTSCPTYAKLPAVRPKESLPRPPNRSLNQVILHYFKNFIPDILIPRLRYKASANML